MLNFQKVGCHYVARVSVLSGVLGCHPPIYFKDCDVRYKALITLLDLRFSQRWRLLGDVMPCSPVDTDWCYRGMYCLHLQDERADWLNIQEAKPIGCTVLHTVSRRGSLFRDTAWHSHVYTGYEEHCHVIYCLINLFFYPEAGGSIILWHVHSVMSWKLILFILCVRWRQQLLSCFISYMSSSAFTSAKSLLISDEMILW
jgi:hypothetical protein